MGIVIIVLLTAIAISAVAAYFSIVGLAALFAATATGVIVMAATLEVGKIVTTKLIHTLWKSKRATWFLKGPLMLMVASLMAVTSLGIYGYLSKGHLEQNAPMAGITIQSEGLERQVAQKTEENKRLETRLAQIDQNIGVFLKNDQATKGLSASKSMKAERDKIQAQINKNYEEINGLSDKLVPLKMKGSEVEAKLGPVKYVAELFGMQDAEAAVRMVILLIMIAFDPLAICLIIAASVAYDDHKDRKRGIETEVRAKREDEEFEIEEETPEIETADEAARIAELNAQLLAEVEGFKAELSTAQSEIERERVLLNASRSAYLKDLADVESREKQTEEAALALAAFEQDLQKRTDELDKRETDLADRITLLEKFFPEDVTDTKAIIALLEKNPNILQDIVDIATSDADKGTIRLNEDKPKDTGGATMVIRPS